MKIRKNIIKKLFSKYRTSKKNLGSRYLKKWALKYASNNGLLDFINELNEKWDSLGVSFVDYCLLYHYIEIKQPQYFLELGTGKSTHIIAKAMHDFCYEKYNGNIKLCSTETEETWYNKAVANIPDEYKNFVEIYNPHEEFNDVIDPKITVTKYFSLSKKHIIKKY